MSNTFKHGGAPVGGLGRVLVVDDQEEIRELIFLYLARLDVTVMSAASAEEALVRVSETVPDLILSDVLMSGMSGFDLCRKLRADPATVMVPVVLITALDARADRIEGINAGASDFLSKPINREEMLARVRSLLELHRARQQLEAGRLAAEVDRQDELRSVFKRYVSPGLVDAILSTPGMKDQALMDQRTRCHAVVMFADLRGFTRMSEMLDPGVVVALLNTFFSLLTDIAYRHGGTIFNMAGDCLMVGFGVPFKQDDASTRAFRCAQDMLIEFEVLAHDWRGTHDVSVGIGVGIDEGEVIAGNVGSPTYMNYTIIGDVVNTAARLKDHARAGSVLLTGRARDALMRAGGGIALLQMAPLSVKGKRDPLSVFQFSAA